MRRLLIRTLGCGFVALALAGCGTSPGAEFVRASRAYYDWSSTELRRYIAEDPSLTAEDREIRLRPIDEYGELLRKVERGRD